MLIEGRCHCGNLSYELVTSMLPTAIRARACDCRFCRIHGTRNWSDPNGSVTVRIADEDSLNRYRFALKTASFYVCRVCGAYLGAVLSDHDGTWSTINLRLSGLDVPEAPASYGKEDLAGRIARRKRVWTPTRIIVGS